MLENITKEIRKNFNTMGIPPQDQLVVDDGFDVLDKERAFGFFKDKSWESVLKTLKQDGYHYLEEWSVLAPFSLVYYFRAYAEYLVYTMSQELPDEEFIYFFFGNMYQVAYMKKMTSFDSKQLKVIEHLSEIALANSKDISKYEYFSDDIDDQINDFLQEWKQ